MFDEKQLAEIKLPYSNIMLGRQANRPQTFVTLVKPLRKIPEDPLAEAKKAAQLIFNESKIKISLCLSAGVDSQCMVQAFVEAKVPFTATIMKFKDGWNNFDAEPAINLCQKLAIDHRIVELNVLNFFENGDHMLYAKNFKCQSPQIATHLWMLDQVDGVPVLSGNPMVPINQDNQIFWLGLPGDLHGCYFRYFIETHRAGAPWFMLQTPELSASFLQVPALKKFTEGEVTSPETFTYDTKCKVYAQAGFKFQKRDAKHTGFEKIREYYDKICGTAHGVGFDQLFRVPMRELNPYPQNSIQAVPINYLSGAI